MDINKDKMNPNNRWCLWKTKRIVGSKGNRLKKKRVGGCRGEGAAPPPARRTKKEVHRHKSRWISIKIKWIQINNDDACRIVGSKGSRLKNKSGWGGQEKEAFLSFFKRRLLLYFFLSFFLPFFLSFFLSFLSWFCFFLIHGFCLHFVIVSLCFLMFSGFCFFDPYLFFFDPYLFFWSLFVFFWSLSQRGTW